MQRAFEQLQTAVTSARVSARAQARRFAGISVAVAWIAAHAALLVVPAATPALAVVGIVLGIGAMLAGVLRAMPASSWRTVTCSDEGLQLVARHEVIELPRDALAEGLVRQSATSWQLRVLTREGVRYDINTPDADTAQRWLCALGLDARTRAVRVITDRPVLQGVVAYLTGGFFSAPFFALSVVLMQYVGIENNPAAHLALTYLAMVPAYWFAARSVGHVDITIGADGIYAGRGWRRRFIPLYAIRTVDISPAQRETVTVTLQDNTTVSWRLRSAGDAVAVARRIHDVLTLRGVALPDALQRTLAARLPEVADAWRDAFLDAARGSGYRDVALSRDDLSRALTSPSVSPAQRLGAVLALRALDHTDALTGVRVAAETVADPAMHRALAATLHVPRQASASQHG